jgi:hypothetical protein
MSAKPDYVVSKLTRPTGGVATGGFVINLTSSTTPMALSQPKDPTLAQYSFFVSRRLEDGRERFRLHMGYFETMQAAEEMLAVVREVYPSAWAGEAPGKKLKANNPAPAAAKPAPTPAPAAPKPAAAAPAPVAKPVAAAPPPAPVAAAPVPPAAPVAPPMAVAPPPATEPEPEKPHPFASQPTMVRPNYEFEEPFVLTDDEPEFKPMDVPVVHPPVVSAPEPAPVAKAPAPKPAPAKAAAKPAPKAAPAKPAAAAKPAATKPAPQKPVAAKPAAPAPAPAAPMAAKPAAPAMAKPAAATPPAVAPKIAAKVSAPALQAAAPAPVVQKPAAVAPPPVEPTVQMPAISATPSLTNVRQVIEELDDLSDTQTIRLLERHSPYREGSRDADVDEAIRVVKPEDTQSMLAIKAEVKRNAPVLFAVQLDWSVTPFDMAKVAPLAIFNAYTLYTTEANREGRTWYGLRLGFFSDAVSAKQVAYYVRSDFKTVSVVPVTTIEKERANDINSARSGIHRAVNVKEGPAPTTRSMTSSNASGIFKLLDDDLPPAIEQDVDGETSPRFNKPAANAAPKAAPAAAAAPGAAKPAPASPGKATKGRKPAARPAARDAHAQVDEETLDQTLEILGAHTLEITNDAAENTGVRHLRVKVDKKGSKFASLIDRLSGKK